MDEWAFVCGDEKTRRACSLTRIDETIVTNENKVTSIRSTPGITIRLTKITLDQTSTRDSRLNKPHRPHVAGYICCKQLSVEPIGCRQLTTGFIYHRLQAAECLPDHKTYRVPTRPAECLPYIHILQRCTAQSCKPEHLIAWTSHIDNQTFTCQADHIQLCCCCDNEQHNYHSATTWTLYRPRDE